MTSSIAAICPDTGQLGIAVTTAWLAVGSLVFLVRPGVGAVACQGVPNPDLRERCLNGLASGVLLEEIIPESLSCDSMSEYRQVGLIDWAGRTVGYTGKSCEGASGHIAEQNYVIAGNLLHSSRVLEAIEQSWCTTGGRGLPIAERLLEALEAGQYEGGDKRGSQSAALFVANEKSLLNVDLRVDDSPAPLLELRRLLKLFRADCEPVYKNL